MYNDLKQMIRAMSSSPSEVPSAFDPRDPRPEVTRLGLTGGLHLKRNVDVEERAFDSDSVYPRATAIFVSSNQNANFNCGDR